MTREAARRRAALSALRHVPPAQLRVAADLLGAAGDPLRRLAKAIEDGAPEEVLGHIAQGAFREDKAAIGVAGQVLGTLAAQIDGLDALSARLGALQTGMAQARQVVDALADDATQDPELQHVLGRVRSAADVAEQLARTANAVTAEGRQLSQDLRGVAERLGGAPENLEEALLPLQERMRRMQELLQTAEGLHSRVGPIRESMDELTAWFQRQRHPGAADLALVSAALSDQLQEPRETRYHRWSEAVTQAASVGRLDVARQAGQRAQALAIEQGDLDGVLRISERIAALADEVGDLRAATLARLERAMVLSRSPAGRQEAFRIVEACLAVAAARTQAGEEGARALEARCHLTLGQLHEGRQDAESARTCYRRVLQLAKEDRSFPVELARAATRLARLQQDHQPFLAKQHLELALQAAAGAGDVTALFEAVQTLLRSGPDLLAATGWLGRLHGLADRIDATVWPSLHAELVREFGRERVSGWSPAP